MIRYLIRYLRLCPSAHITLFSLKKLVYEPIIDL